MQDPRQEPFAILPWQVAADPRLTKSDLRVLIALLSYRSKDTSPLWATRKQIAAHCRLLENNVSRSTAHLEGLGWIRKHHRKRQPTVYEFTVPIEVTKRDDDGLTIVRTLDGTKVVDKRAGSAL